MKVDRYVEPAEFDKWKEVAESMGFLYVASGPLVRSSYKVSEFQAEHLNGAVEYSSFIGWRVLHRERVAGQEQGARTGRSSGRGGRRVRCDRQAVVFLLLDALHRRLSLLFIYLTIHCIPNRYHPSHPLRLQPL